MHGHRPTVPRQPAALPEFCAECVRDNLTYLAGPALHGRGSGTADEHHAAEFIAGKLKQYGLLPAAEDGEYIQTVTIQSRKVIGSPTLSLDGSERGKQGAAIWTHGKGVAFLALPQPDTTGGLQKLDLNDARVTPAAVKEGAAVALKLKPGTTVAQMKDVVAPFLRGKAAIVVVSATPELEGLLKTKGAQPSSSPKRIGSAESAYSAVSVLASQKAFDQIWSAADGTTVQVQGEMTPWEKTRTWNVLARIPGERDDEAILLSAHLDHLGIVNGTTYPGADDDASGTVAVMELARVLAKEPKPRRTVVAALWGSEEAGLIGSRYFLQHPTFDLKSIVANLEFEMIARPDPKLKPDELWLTGWDRSDLGPQLVSHGAKLVADPHATESFFKRSDNYALAEEGIVAQTVSSYGLHKDYHQPTDTLSRVNWTHLDEAIASMIGPVKWLANSEFRPEWKGGEKP